VLAATIHDWIKNCEAKVAAQATQSGTVQHTSDFDQALDQFRQRVYDEKHMQQQKKLPKLQLEKEKSATGLAMKNIMVRRGN
jgi:hypothetical protein